jgi:hypothetical protein
VVPRVVRKGFEAVQGFGCDGYSGRVAYRSQIQAISKGVRMATRDPAVVNVLRMATRGDRREKKSLRR